MNTDHDGAQGDRRRLLGIDLPAGWDSYSLDQRRAWAAIGIGRIALELLTVLSVAARGRPPTAAERLRLLGHIAPGLADAVWAAAPWPGDVAGCLSAHAGAGQGRSGYHPHGEDQRP